MGTDSAFYDAAAWYDFVHEPETDAELPAVMSVFGARGNGGKRILEPACGTGRYLAALSGRGYACLGYDINRNALAFAKKRGASAVEGDMTSFKTTERFDLAFCLIGSFRHLLSEQAAAAHLESTAQLLNPGGLYIVGLDLCDYDAVCDDEEVWEYARGRKKAWHVMTAIAPSRQRRMERILNFVSWRDGRNEGKLESSYDLRSYDWSEWESLLAASPFKLIGWYDQDGRRQTAKRPGYWLFGLLV